MNRFKWYRKWKGGYWYFDPIKYGWYQISRNSFLNITDIYAVIEDWS